MHYEEVELAFRILDNGGSILHCPELEVLHHANEVSRRSEVSVFYKPRNQLLVAAACLPGLKALEYAIPRMVFQFVTACRRGHLKDFVRAMKSASQLIPLRLEKREPLRPETMKLLGELKQGVVP